MNSGPQTNSPSQSAFVERAPGATTRHQGLSGFNKRRSGTRNVTNRIRLTRAIAKGMDEGTLVDLFEGLRNGLAQERRQPGSLKPNELHRVKKQYAIVRAQLLRRGYDAEALDYDPEAHMEEVNEGEDIESEIAA